MSKHVVQACRLSDRRARRRARAAVLHGLLCGRAVATPVSPTPVLSLAVKRCADDASALGSWHTAGSADSGTRCHVNASTPPSDPSGDASQDSVSKAGLANIERTFLKMMFWKNLLSLAGVFTGGAALYLTSIQAEAVRQQTAAAARPYIQFSIADTDDGGEPNHREVEQCPDYGASKFRD